MEIPEELTSRLHHDTSALALRPPVPGIIKELRAAERESAPWNSQNYTRVSASGSSRLHAGNVYNTHYHVNSAPPNNAARKDSDDSKLKQKFLDGLAFPHMNFRSASISAAHPKTCQWLVDCPEYQRWRDPSLQAHHHGRLWIKGKPGAGKSTIMKSLLNHTGKTHVDEMTVSYFFNARGVALEGSVEGMFRCILFQMASKVPLLLEGVRAADLSGYHKNGWPIDVLKELCREAVRLLTRENELNFYIDALDEGDVEDDVRDMVAFLEEITGRAQVDGHNIRVCLASRHYPNISVANSEELSLDAHQDHTGDIVAYVQNQLRINNQTLKAELSSTIVARASGVFLWVALVVKVLNKEADHGNHHLLKDKLQQIPDGLNELFDDIMEKANDDDRLIPAILWMLYAKEPLRPVQLYHAIMVTIGQLSVEKFANSLEQVNDSVIADYIVSSSRGLLEYTIPRYAAERRRTKASSYARRAKTQFIHESVREYFLSHGMRKLDGCLEEDFEAVCHVRLARWCQAYVQLFVQCGYFSKAKQAQFAIRCPLLEYVTKYSLVHAEEASKKECPDLIYAELPFETWLSVFQYRVEVPSTMLQLLVWRNCPTLVNIELEHNAHRSAEERQLYLNTRPSDSRGCAALQIATSLGHIDIARALIKSGADINLYCDRHGTPLHTAIQPIQASWPSRISHPAIDDGTGIFDGNTDRLLLPDNIEMVEMLLKQGADPNESNNTTPHNGALYFAVHTSQKEIVALLLKHGADPNAPKQGILYLAVSAAHKEIVEILLTHGADPNSTSRASPSPETVLNYAVKTRNVDMARLLLLHGADVNQKSEKSGLAVEIAVRQRDAEMVSVLMGSKELIDGSVITSDVAVLDALRGKALSVEGTSHSGLYDIMVLAIHRAWQSLLGDSRISSHLYLGSFLLLAISMLVLQMMLMGAPVFWILWHEK